MTALPPPDLLASRSIRGRVANAWLSAGFEDKAWDDYLRGTPLGQFQQSSMWAQSKRGEGWQCSRVRLEQEGVIVGGFQIVWRTTRFGKVGYVNKGPVLTTEWTEWRNFALDLLLRTARHHRLAALIAQPPDHDSCLVEELENRGFAPNRLLGVIDATLWVDLSGPPGAWEAAMRGRRRTEIRKAMRLGITVYEGGEADIPVFFDLMLSSCQRQGVSPSPSTLEAATQLVRAFGRQGESRLAFAVYQGEMVAAVLDLKFGKRYTTWKKGWNGRHSGKHPNVLLTHHSLRHAYEQGCDCFDFAGVGRSFAQALLAGQPLSPAQQDHYDSFKLGFGGLPRLLAPAMIYCRNPFLRLACRLISTQPALAGWLRSLTAKG